MAKSTKKTKAAAKKRTPKKSVKTVKSRESNASTLYSGSKKKSSAGQLKTKSKTPAKKVAGSPIGELKFKEVKIGDQVWMAANLAFDKFQNGDPIFQAKSAQEFKDAGKQKKPAFICHESDSMNGEKYGFLYNWFAIADPRKLAPEGWQIPTQDDWKKLISKLSSRSSASELKSNKGWKGDKKANNKTGFNALPGGQFGTFNFSQPGSFSSWWSITEDKKDKDVVSIFTVNNEYEHPQTNEWVDKKYGMYVRCVKTR